MMRRILIMAVTVTALTAGLRAGGPSYDEQYIPRFNIPKMTTPPTIDGAIDANGGEVSCAMPPHPGGWVKICPVSCAAERVRQGSCRCTSSRCWLRSLTCPLTKAGTALNSSGTASACWRSGMADNCGWRAATWPT